MFLSGEECMKCQISHLTYLTFQGSGRGRGIGTVTAEDHYHQIDPTKRITREQEGKEGCM